jgi:hypothetical protein
LGGSILRTTGAPTVLPASCGHAGSASRHAKISNSVMLRLFVMAITKKPGFE